MAEKETEAVLTDEQLKQLVAEADTGGRKPTGAVAKLIMFTALAWSLFQLWIASPLPYSLGILVLNDTESRSVHLAFAIFLAYLAYPAFKSSPRAYVPPVDWVLALVGRFLRLVSIRLLLRVVHATRSADDARPGRLGRRHNPAARSGAARAWACRW
jgi:TRAP-type uncharacterized transport system fused permease subunit